MDGAVRDEEQGVLVGRLCRDKLLHIQCARRAKTLVERLRELLRVNIFLESEVYFRVGTRVEDVVRLVLGKALAKVPLHEVVSRVALQRKIA